ncbi:MAG: hypothetical protein JW934_24475 [Anaerolineae bacterium]|nr:hypothetical protein [Anaerolineae bacterium]
MATIPSTESNKQDGPQRLEALWARFGVELILAGVVLLGALIYCGVTLVMYDHLAFPLDDSWIHLVIARGIAREGALVYNPGEPTNGSTAPLWSLLLSVGYLLKIDFLAWDYGLGLLFAWLSGVFIYRLGKKFLLNGGLETRPTIPMALIAAVLSSIEWHVAWCGLAGMETTLFIFLSVYLLYSHLRGFDGSFLGMLALGGLGALLVLTRPEGLGLVGLVALDGVLRQKTWRARVLYVVGWAVPFLLVLGPNVLYNVGVTGQPLPATFYAKAAEFVDPTERTLLHVARNWLLLLFWTAALGPQLLLLPGIVYGIYLGVRRRQRLVLLILGWIALLLGAYALHLPLMSHHGRYYVPLFPLLILIGVWGVREVTPVMRRFKLLRRMYALAVAAGFVILWLNGAVVYAKDVRLIDDEWLPVSFWLRDNTAPDALVAAHDIGALGYFAERRIIDMAGLVTPGAIPHIGDEASMREYLRQEGVDYFVTYPQWYPKLIRDPAFELVFEGTSPYLRQQFGHNLQVYRTHWE